MSSRNKRYSKCNPGKTFKTRSITLKEMYAALQLTSLLINHSFFSFLKNIIRLMQVTVIAITSAHGEAKSIPFIPNIIGNIITSGTKQTISLVNDTTAAFTGCPTDWKNIDDTFIMHVNVTRDKNIRNVFSANSL